jgi:hypothetical protein
VINLPVAILFVTLTCIAGLVRANPADQDRTPTSDPAQLIGRRIKVNNMRLCEPGTYKVDVEHAGMEAVIISEQPRNKSPLPRSELDRLSPDVRDNLLDQQQAVMLTLQFSDGSQRETCVPIGPKKLSESITVVSGSSSSQVAPGVPSSSQTGAGVKERNAIGTMPTDDLHRNAGGKWFVETIRNRMTDVASSQFNLMADNEIHDGIVTKRPALAIVCRAGRVDDAQFQTGVVLDTPSIEGKGLLNIQVPEHYVRVRLDNKISTFTWEHLADSKSMGICCRGFSKNGLEKILKASDVRIEFGSFGGYDQVATFSPSGLDRQMLRETCGIKIQ